MNTIQEFGDSLPSEQRARWFEIHRRMFDAQLAEHDLNALRREPVKYITTRWHWPQGYLVDIQEVYRNGPALAVTLIKERRPGYEAYVDEPSVELVADFKVSATVKTRWVPEVLEQRFGQRITWYDYRDDRRVNDMLGFMCHRFGVEAPRMRSDAELLKLIREGEAL